MSTKPIKILKARFCTELLERHLLLLFSSRVMSFNSLEPKQPISGRDMRHGPIRGSVTFSPDGAWHFWYQRLSCLGQDSASPGSQCPSSTWPQDSGWPFRVVMSLLPGWWGRGPDQWASVSCTSHPIETFLIGILVAKNVSWVISLTVTVTRC